MDFTSIADQLNIAEGGLDTHVRAVHAMIDLKHSRAETGRFANLPLDLLASYG